MSLSFHQSWGGAQPLKRAIPRLAGHHSGEPGGTRGQGNRADKRRIATACASCRVRKVKCNGERPRCQNCLDNEEACVYVTGRKDKLKIATQQNQRLLSFLHDIKSLVSAEVRQQIEDVIEEAEGDVCEVAGPSESSRTPTAISNPEEECGEANVAAEVGSNEETDILDEDLLRDEHSRAVGFFGKNSEVQWIRRLQREISLPDDAVNRDEGPFGPPGNTNESELKRMEALRQRKLRHDRNAPLPITASTFYLDSNDIETDFPVDPFVLPSFEVAERLVNSYMETVHDTFPILSKERFTSQFYHVYESIREGKPLEIPQRWRATLNMVFAIGAKYSHLIKAEWRGDDRDHIIYHSRGKTLGWDGSSLLTHPSLEQIQIIALLAIYYLAIGHVNRAWVALGTSLRFAYALGLHLRNEDPNTSNVKKETLGRIWWGHYCLERLLSTIAGRPSIVVDDYCSVRLPLPLATEQLTESLVSYKLRHQEANLHAKRPDSGPKTPTQPGFSSPARPSAEPANAGTYLKAMIGLNEIKQKVMLGLYSAGTATKSWEIVQQTMMGLTEQLEAWESSLPSGFNFSLAGRNNHLQRESLHLALCFYSTKIVATRPCLCRIDRRIKTQTKASDDFNKQMAQVCVASAKAIVELLPDDIDTLYLYETGPWWAIVHFIMQALAVLLLEISYSAVGAENDSAILKPTKKLIRWLRVMKENHEVAERAYGIAFGILRKLANKLNVDIIDMVEEHAAEDTAMTNAPAEFTSQQSFPEPEYEQEAAIPGPSNLPDFAQDDAAGFESMFAFPPSGPHHLDPNVPFVIDPSHAIPPDLLQAAYMQGNPFYTAYDEQNPLPGPAADFFSPTEGNAAQYPHESFQDGEGD